MADINSVIAPPVQILSTIGAQQGPPGSSAARYDHTQSSPATTWTVNHNLGVYPDVTLLTVGGVEFNGQIAHQSVNQFLVQLASALAGTAICQA